MEEMNELATQQALGKNSLAARFKKIIKQTRFSLIAGVVLLILLIVASVSHVSISQEEIESARALSRYRMGSKTLTAAVQSYAVTGDTQYYDAYMKELNIDKNRDAALEILQNNDIKAGEWEKLNEIAGLSDGLVPLEKEAMAAVAAGNTQAAIDYVFGVEYTEAVQRINDLTGDTIDEILDRFEAKNTSFLILEVICALVFVAAFIRLEFDIIKTIRFSEKELLKPIIKVSEQMTEIAHGNLQAKLDLERDDSEVGNMAASIDFMKGNMAGMIEELKKAADSAIQAEQAKALFLSNMSHEIRTPVNAILGMNEMILRECTDSQLLTYSGNIQSSGRTLLSLINDILDLSKIESGKMEIIPTEYNTGDLFMDLWNVIYLRAEKKGLMVSFTLDETIPGTLYGDDVRVKQVVTNILTNAVKYTLQGGVELHAAYEKQGEDMITLTISVRDTGIGIKEEDLGKLFDSFQRLDEDKNRNIEGTGLGMSITLMLLKLMDGDIEVQSVYHEGSTFTVRIPQKVISNEPVGDFESVRNSHTLVDDSRNYDSFEAPGANILVVDDNAPNLVVFTSFLKLTKMNIVTAESGEKCLELVKEQPFHIIFMDHLMPGMDGVETLHEIRQMKGSPNEKTPVVALTANAVSGAREYYLKEGFVDYLTKPIDSDKLEQMTVTYLPEELVYKRRIDAEEGAAEESRAEESRKENSVAEESGSGNNDRNRENSMSTGNTGQNRENSASTESAGKNTDRNQENNVPRESGAGEYSRYQEYGISIEKGISNMAGSKDLYLNIVEMFVNDKEEKQVQLKQFMTDQNAHDYGIKVHALKGDARTLGADSLADVAYEHEKQSKAGNLAYVEEHWDELVERWDRARAGFEEFCGENGRGQAKTSVTATPATADTVTAGTAKAGNVAAGNTTADTAMDAGSRTIRITPEEIAGVISLIDEYETIKATVKMREWLQNSLVPEQRMSIERALAAIEKEYDEDKAIEILTTIDCDTVHYHV